jgi:iron(III) transport system ATP-binding protein
MENAVSLEVIALTKTLGHAASPQASAVLRGVNLAIAPGECLGLKGATGSGKTTLIRIIAGLMAPDGGEVHLDGQFLSSSKKVVPPAERGIGLVFQSLGLWPHLSVKAHLDFVLSAGKHSAADKKERCAQTLETFLLRDLAGRFPAELSGGERHLLALARVFCSDMLLLLLDEPFNGLDSGLKTRILETLAQERTRRKLTTLLVTHNDDEMRLLCKRVEHLSEGRIIEHARRMSNAE